MDRRDDVVSNEKFIKTKKQTTKEAIGVFDGNDDSFVDRPINHVNDVCYCYEDPADCTTCDEQATDESAPESSSSDSNVFVVDDTPMRFFGGSTHRSISSCSSSDGSSLFDDASPIPDNVRAPVVEKPPELRWSALADATELERFMAEKHAKFMKDVQSIRLFANQIKEIYGFQMALHADILAWLEQRVADEGDRLAACVRLVTRVTHPFESRLTLIDECREKHAALRNLYLSRLIDEDVMSSNLARQTEIKSRLAECRRRQKKSTKREQNAEHDDVSTCRSFCQSFLACIL